VDVSVASEGEPVERFQKIERQLNLYSEELYRKTRVLVATKIDIADEEKLLKLEQFAREEGIEFYKISALTGRGLKEFLYGIFNLLKTAEREAMWLRQ
jgi:GTP-binding protein